MLNIKKLMLGMATLAMPVMVFAQVTPEPDAPVSPLRLRAALIYQRLAGVKLPIDAQQLKDMEALLAAGKLQEAADIATKDPGFLNITVKHFATRMSTRDETPTAPLSDFVATVIGTVRDSDTKSAKTLLTTDSIYVGDPSRVPASVGTNLVDDIIRSNNHYLSLEQTRADVGSLLVEQRQQTLDRNQAVVNLPDAAGLITSRAFTEAHAIAGTNRRMIHFTFRQFLCTDITQWSNTALPGAYIGRDVDRAPGGVPETFDTNCKGCHSPMDAMRGAFAHLDFPDNIDNPFLKHGTLFNGARGTGQFQFRAEAATPEVAEKYARNKATYPQGYITTSAEWRNNLAVFNSNAAFFEWRNVPADGSGVGVKRYGQMLADSGAFSRCMVQRVFRSVCKREVSQLEGSLVAAETTKFESDYNLRKLFERIGSSTQCLGE